MQEEQEEPEPEPPTVNGTTYNPEVLPNEAVWAPSGENGRYC
uniref:Uncharacterized protein n=1 Tax=Parascaris equorum TaxID=6256 RepID=A0A914RGV9_PAREQ